MRKLRHTTAAQFHADAIASTISPFDVYNGTEGDDTYTGTSQDDTITGNGGNDTLNGGDGGDLIDGGEGNDLLAGDGGDDILRGGAGDDTIKSTAGADTVDGGDGTDTWIGSYASATGTLTFDQRTGALSNGTTLVGIESIQLTTGRGADQFTMNGEQAFSIDAGGGADSFTFDPTGGSRSDAPLTVTVGNEQGLLNVTFQNGDVVSRVEQLAIVGSSAGDLFVIGNGKLQDSSILSLDGAGGYDKLSWDLRDSSVTFVVHRDGTTESSMGTVVNFEVYDLTVGYATNVVLGAGDDTVNSYHGGIIRGGAGDDMITMGGDSNGEVYGGAGSDTISTYGDDVLIFGNDGDDIIKTDGRNETIDGGLGFDQWSAELLGKTDYDQSTNKFSDGTTLINIEKVIFDTSYSYDLGTTINITQVANLTVRSHNEADDFIIDLTGLQTGVSLSASMDENKAGHITFGETNLTAFYHKHRYQYVSFKGTSADDIISLNDIRSNLLLPRLDGGAGLDTLGVHLAADGRFIVADDGTVTSTSGEYINFERFHITVHDGENVVSLGGADDTIVVAPGATSTNELSGGGGADVITAAGGADKLVGGDGDDRLNGGDGIDTLNGGLGDDTIDGGAGIDVAGYDGATAGVTVALKVGAQDTRGAGIDTLTGIENLYGSEFNDKLTGDDLANVLRGREGEDLLKGGAGDDRLEGGSGADRVLGGAGADTFAFMKLTDISTGLRDRILDFSHADGDRIELSNIDLSKDPGDQQFTFVGTSAFTGSATIFELRVQDNGNGNFLVQGDVNHDGKADFTFAVKTDGPLVAADFLL